MSDLGEQLVDAVQAVTGVHPGHRVLHAKGVGAEGWFRSSGAAARLTTAAHLQPGADVGVVVRFSNGSAEPAAHDGAHDGRGMATKFRLDDGSSTDIVALSLPVFFVRTTDDFIDFVRGPRARSGHGRDGPRARARVPRRPSRGTAGRRAVGGRAGTGELRPGDLPQRPRVLDDRRRRWPSPGALPLGAGDSRRWPARRRGDGPPAGLPRRRARCRSRRGPGAVRPARRRGRSRRPGRRSDRAVAGRPALGRGRHARAHRPRRCRAADLRPDTGHRGHRVLRRSHPGRPQRGVLARRSPAGRQGRARPGPAV